MQTSDCLQLVSIICSSILSVIAIIVSVLALKQNNKMIFESNKPYISIFSKAISCQSTILYLVLKNFGKSGAIILNIDYDKNFDKNFDIPPFKNMENIFIAPNQSFAFPLDYNNNIDTIFNVQITYKYLNKIYIENHRVNFSHYLNIGFVKTHGSKDLKEISDILQEMIIQNI